MTDGITFMDEFQNVLPMLLRVKEAIPKQSVGVVEKLPALMIVGE